MVRTRALPTAELWVIRDGTEDFAAFMGLRAACIEMLFVAPARRGEGLGSRLVRHAVEHCGARRVDVNEQNTQARGFYARLGFRIAGREPLDPSGRSYPILHLRLPDRTHP